jgi:deoxyguanosine kinase
VNGIWTILKLFCYFVVTMKTQHQVVLSLGSNQGNRLENIENALQLIHQEVGTIIKVSRLYETPSWGFESDAFYNCALLIHTYKNPEEVLNLVLTIENKLGRIRSENQGYQSRSIDIDLITFNEEIISSENLQIPHPLMQDRKFVLLPMLDLELNWTHPIFKKNISQLLENSSDESQCTLIQNIESPLQKTLLKQFNFISFEGNIGVGKTTLTTKIAEDFNATLITERFLDNPFLVPFFSNQKQNAFSNEVSFLVDRYHQLADNFENSISDNAFIVADYVLFKSLIFAKINLDENEYNLYQSLFEILYKEVSKPDLVVYLYQSQERLLENIKKRGREFEQNIQPEYLEKINRGYLEFLESKTLKNVITIDVTHLDFVKNQSDYILILEEIKKGILEIS